MYSLCQYGLLKNQKMFTTVMCACFDKTIQCAVLKVTKKKTTRESSPSGVCTGICSALQGFRRGSGGAMLRTHSAQGRSTKRSEVYILNLVGEIGEDSMCVRQDSKYESPK